MSKVNLSTLLFLFLICPVTWGQKYEDGCRGNCRQDGGPVEVEVNTGGTEVTVNDGAVTVEGSVVEQGGNSVQIGGDTFPRQAPPIWLNQSGNVVNCARIIGFGSSNTSGSFVFGIPAGRQKDCDIWLAVNETQENGHVALSYAFMCEIKHVGGVWGRERCNDLTDQAIAQLDAYIVDPGLMMAEVSDEEFEEYQAEVEEEHELVETRIAQQANLIQSLTAEQAAKDAEIIRLQAEADRLRAAQQKRIDSEGSKRNALMDILARIEAKEVAAEESTDE